MRRSRAANSVPAPRSEGLLIRPVGEEMVVYDQEAKEAHCLKPLAAFVFTACDGETRIDEIASMAKQHLGTPVTVDQVADAVVELEESKLLYTPLVLLDSDDVSRRELMRRVGFAGAAATVGTGLITSIAAPPAMAQCSGQPAGCNCTRMNNGGNAVHDNGLCLSGHCCGGGANDACNIGCCSSTNNGNECQCLNEVCPSVPAPTSGCCNGICTPNTGTACQAR